MRASKMDPNGPSRLPYSFVVHDVLATDDHVVTLIELTARRGERTLRYRVAEIHDVRDGKVVERRAFSDDTERIASFFRS